ncbi:hypothetical protein BT63DRAFT_264384 [Microthyrium microscopicum]|uniref:Uncharacterized protein n=1 Tax=Microthyrium microscopicum TaxID=703497 RepID=A0A6A6UCH8_9PEZI|nr:hypothetical protein BT63DRAFT_264384 [Microthyrium microscopicum]
MTNQVIQRLPFAEQRVKLPLTPCSPRVRWAGRVADHRHPQTKPASRGTKSAVLQLPHAVRQCFIRSDVRINPL